MAIELQAERAEALLDDFLKEHPQFIELSSTDAPVILGECSFAPSSQTPHLQYLHEDGPASSTTNPFRCALVMYRRSALGSARFHAPVATNTTTATSHRGNASSNGHLVFETIGLDDRALTQLNATYRLHSLLNLSGSWLARFKLLDVVARYIYDKCARPQRAFPRLFSGLKFILGMAVGFVRHCGLWIAFVRGHSKLLDQLWARLNLVHGLISYPRLSYVYGKLETSTEYVRFNNAIWLVMNDVILGIVVGALISENSGFIGATLHDWLKAAFIDFTHDTLLWLDNWPEGLKLNAEFSSFLVHTLLGVLELWAYLLRSLSPHFSIIVYVTGLAGYGGLSMLLSLFLDMFNVLTLHVSLSHLVLKNALSYQISALRSLFNLFRGKRFNVLHQRTDSWNYQVDQLILGTLLFTLFTFSLPTLLTYGILFTLMKLVVVTTCSLLKVATDLMNHFPLFALSLRVKDPRRLPGSTYFRVIRDNGHPILVLEVGALTFLAKEDTNPIAQVQTISLWTIFEQYGLFQGDVWAGEAL
ncbi:N-acetylglucosaminyl transferase component-domain-containing protein [Russula earlei]|uniref:N-acetylglucosaminyl transferase component-domain-containing protein n=1 Tax=Russula earlei TaxID=71964 RepID=A0ACC0UF54_9AGAM|nr:N-acetylglucosaminyl transferase component-domain-containing protein [Russula earlei]